MLNLTKKLFNTNISFLITLTVIVFCVYGKSINFELIDLDDNTLITNKINYISDISNIPEFFLTSCFYSKEDIYYRPILALTFSIESIIFGLNFKIYHTTNLILFILNIYLLYLFLLKLNLNKNIIKLILILLSIYPVISSCCVWITARNDLLLSIFILLTLINIVNYSNTQKDIYLVLLSAFFTLSVFTKETAIIFIIIYPLFTYLFKYNFTKKQLTELLIISVSVLIIYFLLRFISVNQINIKEYLINFNIIIENIINGFSVYVYSLFTPYYVPIAYLDNNIYFVKIFITFLFIIFLTVIWYKNIIERKYLIFGILLFVLGLVPTFLTTENTIYFHRLLLPLSGLIIILIEFIQKIIKKRELLKKFFILLFIILFTIFSFLTFTHIDKYKNNYVFFTNGYMDAPKYHIFLNAIAKYYIEYEKYDKALDLLFLADKYKPNFYINDIATVLCYQGKIDEAEELLKKSIEAGKNKDVSYANLSLIYRNKKDYKTALYYATKAYEENPYNIEVNVNLAQMYRLNNEFIKPIELYNNLIKFDKHNSEYYYSLGILYNDLKDKNNAIKFLEKACNIDKNNKFYLKKLEEIKNIED